MRDRPRPLRAGAAGPPPALAAFDPPWAAFEPEDYPLKGGHRWQVQVPAGQQKKLRVVYIIKLSAKKELIGGNRREQ